MCGHSLWVENSARDFKNTQLPPARSNIELRIWFLNLILVWFKRVWNSLIVKCNIYWIVTLRFFSRWGRISWLPTWYSLSITDHRVRKLDVRCFLVIKSRFIIASWNPDVRSTNICGFCRKINQKSVQIRSKLKQGQSGVAWFNLLLISQFDFHSLIAIPTSGHEDHLLSRYDLQNRSSDFCLMRFFAFKLAWKVTWGNFVIIHG